MWDWVSNSAQSGILGCNHHDLHDLRSWILTPRHHNRMHWQYMQKFVVVGLCERIYWRFLRCAFVWYPWNHFHYNFVWYWLIDWLIDLLRPKARYVWYSTLAVLLGAIGVLGIAPHRAQSLLPLARGSYDPFPWREPVSAGFGIGYPGV